MNQIVNIIFAAIITTLLVGCGQKNETESNAANTVASAEQPSQGDPLKSLDAMYEQAKNYHSGLNGSPVDKAKAFEMFSTLAEKGSPGGMFFLGVMLDTGDGVPADPKKAMEWLEKSDKLGCGAAAPYIKEIKARMAKKKK